MKNFREKIIEYGTYIINCLVPILYFGGSRFIPHVTSKTFFFYGGVEIIFALWLYSVIFDESYRLSKKNFLFFLPLAGFLSWMTIAGLAGANPEMSFWSSLGRGTGLLTLYHLSAFALIIASLVQKKGSSYVRTLINFFLAGAAILTLSVWFGDEGFNLPITALQKSKGGGLIGNSSLAAAYLIFALFFCFYSFAGASRRRKIWSSILAGSIIFSPLFVNLYGLLAGHSIIGSARGALLGIILGSVISLLSYWSLSIKKIYHWLGIGGITISLILLSLGWHQLVKPDTWVHQKFTDSATGSRFLFWNIASKAMNEKPILGWGPENYTVIYQKYFDPHLYLQSSVVEIWNDRAHNIFFETGVAGGYPAILLYIGFLISIVYASFRAYSVGRIDRLQFGLLSGLISGYVFQNLFVFDSISSLLGLFIVIGIVFGLSGDNSEKWKTSKSSVYKMKTLVACIIFALFIPTWIIFAWMPARKTETISSVVSLALNDRPSHYADLLPGSPAGNAWEVGGIAYDTYVVYTKNIDQIKSNPKLLSFAQKDLEKFLAYLEIISKKEPNDYRLYLSMARLYNIYMDIAGKKNDQDLIRHVLDIEHRAQELSPQDPQADWTLSQTLIYNKDLNGAEFALKHSISLAPYLTWSRQLLIGFAKDTRNNALYQESLIEARQVIPDFSIE